MFHRFVFLRVGVLVFRVLGLSSTSCQESSSHQESCCISVSCVLQQVVHYKRAATTQGLSYARRRNAEVTVARSCPWAPQPRHQLTAFFAEDEEKLCSCPLHVHVNVCHEANQFVSDCGADLWPDLCIFQWRKYLKRQAL